MPRESFLRKREKGSRVLRFQQEIVALVRLKESGDLAATHAFARAAFKSPPEVGLPFAQVVIDIDDRNFRFLSAAFQAHNVARRRRRVF